MFTVTYTQTGTTILATVFDDKGVDQWPGGHYLSSDEAALLQTDPSALDAQIILVLPPPPTPVVPPTPVIPVQVRTAMVDPTAAAITVETFNVTKSKVADGIAALLAQAQTLPIDTQAALLTQVQALLTAAATPSKGIPPKV